MILYWKIYLFTEIISLEGINNIVFNQIPNEWVFLFLSSIFSFLSLLHGCESFINLLLFSFKQNERA